jgi:hypothetical protein
MGIEYYGEMQSYRRKHAGFAFDVVTRALGTERRQIRNRWETRKHVKSHEIDPQPPLLYICLRNKCSVRCSMVLGQCKVAWIHQDNRDSDHERHFAQKIT